VDVWSEAIAESLLKKENKERCCAMFLQITLANLLEYINLGVSLKQIPTKSKEKKTKSRWNYVKLRMNWAFKTAKQFYIKTESSDYSIISGLNFVFRKQVPCCFTLTSIDKVQDTRPKIGYGITADIKKHTIWLPATFK
jgi:hypothetical protein